MNKLKYVLILLILPNLLDAQSVDLSSVDAFFDVTSTLKSGGEVSNEQWENFDNSTLYKCFVNREDKLVINSIKKSIHLAFEGDNTLQIDSILNISKDKMLQNKEMLLKKLILDNYLNVNENYADIKFFRNEYDFDSLIVKSKEKLSSFLGHPLDSLTELKSVHFFFFSADAKDGEDAILVDLNLIYRQTEEQRIELIAHEYFHNYRRRFENHDFNYKCDLNHSLDMIQNEGIADLIDKSEGYKKHYTENGELSEIGEIFVNLYHQSQNDLEKLHNLVVKYSKDEIVESKMVDELIEIVKYNGHHIGFYMSNQIVRAGYRKQMIETFYDPFEFYKLYNIAAKKNDLFQLSDEFMEFIFKR